MKTKKTATESFRVDPLTKEKYSELVDKLGISRAALFEALVESLFDSYKAGRVTKQKLSLFGNTFKVEEQKTQPAAGLEESFYTPGQKEEIAAEDKTHLNYTPRRTYTEEEVFDVVRKTLEDLDVGEKK